MNDQLSTNTNADCLERLERNNISMKTEALHRYPMQKEKYKCVSEHNVFNEVRIRLLSHRDINLTFKTFNQDLI